jgi:Fe-S-cluster containining protein
MEQPINNKELMDLTRVEINGADRRVVFRGDCFEMQTVCQAMCCREWVVRISTEEYASNLYDSEVVCELTDKACRDVAQPCLTRRYQLSKHEDKSCVYLENNLCKIYDMRPTVCRKFQCQDGWHLSSVLPAIGAPRDQKPPTLTQETFVSKLNDDAIFVQHPLLKVHTVFYLKQKREIIFVKEMVGACGKFNTRDSFDYPQLDDAQLLTLIDLFNSKETLHYIYARFCSKSVSKLTQQEFYAIVWLLNKHNIVLEVSNLKGMLSGMGGIN